MVTCRGNPTVKVREQRGETGYWTFQVLGRSCWCVICCINTIQEQWFCQASQFLSTLSQRSSKTLTDRSMFCGTLVRFVSVHNILRKLEVWNSFFPPNFGLSPSFYQIASSLYHTAATNQHPWLVIVTLIDKWEWSHPTHPETTASFTLLEILVLNC